MHLARVLVFGLALAGLAASPAMAGGPTAPEEWVGVWEFTQTVSDCGGGNEMVDEYVEVICPDDLVFDPDPSGETGFECEGTVDENSFEYMCEATYTIFDCEITITMQMAGERTGDTYTASGTIATVVVATGEMCKPGETCQEISVTGVRTNPDPAECVDIPTETSTWGEIKTRYR